MSHNTFGHLFRVTTWGESHGPGLGCVVDGCPPGIELTIAEIQSQLDKRKPGQSRHTTQRHESDAVQVLSGVMPSETKPDVLITTGTPISMLILNEDQRSKDYSEIKDRYRPGHADFTYDAKYGFRDYRGGGRASARETAARVAAGAIARKVVPGLNVRGAMIQMGVHPIDPNRWDWNQIDHNDYFCPDAETAELWAEYLEQIRLDRNSIGAVIHVEATGVPVGLGAPIYGKLDQDIAAALMSINAVKGVEIGAGFDSAELLGTENADQMTVDEHGQLKFLSNNAGGILGGISTGQPIVARFAVKPTSSILTGLNTVTSDLKPVEIITKGRHDPCVGIRAVPIGEAMLAIVIADHYLRHRGQTGRG